MLTLILFKVSSLPNVHCRLPLGLSKKTEGTAEPTNNDEKIYQGEKKG